MFSPAPFFLVRTPLLPIETFFSLLEAKDHSLFLFQLFQNNPQVQEAIAIASPALFELLQQIVLGRESSKKKIEQAESSLFKYIVRMSTRATPFGLFSFVSLGSWQDEHSSVFDLSKIKKRGRPDMEWLMKQIDHLSQERELMIQFPLKRHPLLYQSLDKIILSYTRKNAQQISIRNTPLVKRILYLTKAPISHHDLIDKVLIQMPTLDRYKVEQVIDSMRQQDFLCPSILPTLLTDSPYADFITKLKQISPFNKILEKYEKIDQLFQDYNSTAAGEGIHLLQMLSETMKEDKVPLSFIQVDSINEEEIQLPHKIALELSEGIEILLKLALAKPRNSILQAYHQKFVEKYGASHFIPLQDLLDETIGIGIPQEYLKSIEKITDNVPWESWLIQEWACCLRENKTEIELTDDFIQRFCKGVNLEQVPPSFDVFFEIISNYHSNDLILLKGFSDISCCCATMGRFSDIFTEKGKALVQNFIQEEEKLNPHIIFGEISYFPSESRLANVAIHPNFRSLTLDLGYSQQEEKSLSLEDIYVGATQNHLYLTLENGKQLILYSTNLLTPFSAPHIVRFLRDICRESFQLFAPFSWGKAEVFPFLPSIRYKNILFSPAKWHLSLDQIKATHQDTHESLISKINDWANDWQLPRFILMTEEDNYILLDRTHPSHLKEIAHRLKNFPKFPIVLQEKRENEERVKSNQGSHRSEFVVPFIKTQQHFPLVKPVKIGETAPFSTRYKIPGGEWFYAKIYLPKDHENRFLTSFLKDFILEVSKDIETWFFIRYQDKEGTHIRLRCKVPNSDILGYLSTKFHNWFHLLLQKGWVKEIQLATYEREIERYGGLELIDIAEKFFQSDSETTLSLLELVKFKKCNLPDYILTALSLIDLLEGFGISLDMQKDFFSKMDLKREHLNGFREWKKQILIILDVCQNKRKEGFDEEVIQLTAIFEKRREKQQKYAIALQEIPQRESIIHSLLHMHCNRMMGVDNLLEQKAYSFASNSVLTYLMVNIHQIGSQSLTQQK